jgi:hypothetical protein
MLKAVFLTFFCSVVADVAINGAGATLYVVSAAGHGVQSLGHFGSSLMDVPGQ